MEWEILYRGATDSTGYIRISFNGVVCMERHGPSNRAANETAGYMKYGIYDVWHTVDTSLVIYHDDISYYSTPL